MKVAIGNDHAGPALKEEIVLYLKSKGIEVINMGVDTEDSVDYPDYAKLVCDKVVSKEVDFGILICGTGIGISIAANKIKGIRAALCHDAITARLCKEHNNANVIAFGARIIDKEIAKEIIDAYLSAEFAGDRHQRRIDKITALEN